MKTCSNPNCQQTNPQPYTSFYKEKVSADGYKARCKSCIKTHTTQLYKDNAELLKSRSHKWKKANPQKVKDIGLRKLYGITLDQYHEILRKQGSCCAICRTDKPNGRSDEYFSDVH